MNLFLQQSSTFNNSALKPDPVVNFAGMVNMQDFWIVHGPQGPILQGLYMNWEKYYNNDNVTKKNFIFYENKLLGVPRFRQLRVKNNSCNVNPIMKKMISSCYGDYSYFNEDQTSFGRNQTSANLTDTA